MAVLECPNTQVGPEHTYCLLLKEVLETGGGVLLSTHRHIQFNDHVPGKPLSLWRCVFLLVFQVRLLHFHKSAHISVCIATLHILCGCNRIACPPG